MKCIEYQYAQGSMEWHHARLGIPTASGFCNILTPAGKPTKSAARQTYMHKLLGERLTGKPMLNFVSAAMERGIELEPKAREWYAFDRGVEVRQIGFATLEPFQGMLGCSPDGLVDPEGGIEIKCPLLGTMIAYLLADGPPEDYQMQVQACLWITGRQWWDLVA